MLFVVGKYVWAALTGIPKTFRIKLTNSGRSYIFPICGSFVCAHSKQGSRLCARLDDRTLSWDSQFLFVLVIIYRYTRAIFFKFIWYFSEQTEKKKTLLWPNTYRGKFSVQFLIFMRNCLYTLFGFLLNEKKKKRNASHVILFYSKLLNEFDSFNCIYCTLFLFCSSMFAYHNKIIMCFFCFSFLNHYRYQSVRWRGNSSLSVHIYKSRGWNYTIFVFFFLEFTLINVCFEIFASLFKNNNR